MSVLIIISVLFGTMISIATLVVLISMLGVLASIKASIDESNETLLRVQLRQTNDSGIVCETLQVMKAIVHGEIKILRMISKRVNGRDRGKH